MTSTTPTPRVRGKGNPLVHLRSLIARYQPDLSDRGLAAKARRESTETVARAIERIYKTDSYPQNVYKMPVLIPMAKVIGCRAQELALAFNMDLFPELVDDLTAKFLAALCKVEDPAKRDEMLAGFIRTVEESTGRSV